MKQILLLIAIGGITVARAQTDSIQAGVYAWKDAKVQKDSGRERRQIIEGIARVLPYLEIHASTLAPGKAPHPPHKHADEEMVIVKEGQLTVTIEGQSKVLGPGSVALAVPGDMHGFVNSGKTTATYYVMRCHSASPDMARAKAAGGSFMINYNDVEYKPHDHGGVRNYFVRPTAMMKRFDIHVTTLDAGKKSHDPHTHAAEEIVLMIKGNGNMQIGQEHIPCTTGDLIFLKSMVLHAITNNSNEPIQYFAIQWD